MVVPAFAKVFASFHTELPLLTKVLIASSNFMVDWWWGIAVGAAGGAFAWRGWLATAEGRLTWDRWKLRIPIAGKIILKATLSRFARSFALAARSGVPVISGLGLVARTVDNEHIGARIERMREGVSRGESVLRTAHAAGVFTPVALQMIAVGEESGALDQLIEDVADMYQRDVQYELKTLSAQLEPILITMLGVMVLILALGVFLPMWDLSQAMFRR
jgi:MSHA biogenesis protein MshG